MEVRECPADILADLFETFMGYMVGVFEFERVGATQLFFPDGQVAKGRELVGFEIVLRL